MERGPGEFIQYKQARFSAKLPVNCRYTASHLWMRETEASLWQVGFTRFAVRTLGDIVEHGFQAKPGDIVKVGQVIGWVEGFKALSDLPCVIAGAFVGGNPAIEQDVTLMDSDPHGEGWLYCVRGTPDPNSLDVHAYIKLLDTSLLHLKHDIDGDACEA